MKWQMLDERSGKWRHAVLRLLMQLMKSAPSLIADLKSQTLPTVYFYLSFLGVSIMVIGTLCSLETVVV